MSMKCHRLQTHKVVTFTVCHKESTSFLAAKDVTGAFSFISSKASDSAEESTTRRLKRVPAI